MEGCRREQLDVGTRGIDVGIDIRTIGGASHNTAVGSAEHEGQSSDEFIRRHIVEGVRTTDRELVPGSVHTLQLARSRILRPLGLNVLPVRG